MSAESQLEERMRRWVTARGGLYLKWVSPGNDGVPDRIIILNGHVVFHELKTDTGELEVSQERMIPRIEAALAAGPPGVRTPQVRVTYGAEGLEELMTELIALGVA